MKITTMFSKKLRPMTFTNFGSHQMESLEGVWLASFRSRLFAFIIDIFIVLIIYVLVSLPFELRNRVVDAPGNLIVHFEPFHGLWAFLTVIAYFSLSTYWGNGQTIGKKLFKIRIISLYHHHLSLWQCIERSLGYAASSLEGGFGFMQYFIHLNHQTVHDRIAETIVVSLPLRSSIKSEPNISIVAPKDDSLISYP